MLDNRRTTRLNNARRDFWRTLTLAALIEIMMGVLLQ